MNNPNSLQGITGPVDPERPAKSFGSDLQPKDETRDLSLQLSALPYESLMAVTIALIKEFYFEQWKIVGEQIINSLLNKEEF